MRAMDKREISIEELLVHFNNVVIPLRKSEITMSETIQALPLMIAHYFDVLPEFKVLSDEKKAKVLADFFTALAQSTVICIQLLDEKVIGNVIEP
jgi:hypothetical protein